MHRLGDRVYFWTGRGSQGYATIREFRGDHILLNPEPEATKGSDYRTVSYGSGTYWAPRDRGVLAEQINTSPRVWYINF
jgi:hypothetical protein